MTLTCDLHIHSALSPCADNDMTPGNIVGMASLKGLDVIAITDHQRCANVGPAMKIAESYGVAVIPGMELETAEEIHFICLFPDLQSAEAFESLVADHMPAVLNREDIFGEEWLFNDEDERIGKEPNLLLTPCSFSYQDAFREVEKAGGVCYPAHVDRDAYSILSSFGMIPPEVQSKTLEISASCDVGELLSAHPELKDYRLLRASDAHALGTILEPGSMVEIAQDKNAKNFISQFIHALRQ